MVCFIGITFLILLFVQFSIQSLDERFDEDWMQSPVIKSYERHLNKISLRLNGRPAVVRGRVKRYRCIEEYIPSVDDLQESAFDPTFIQNEDASALRRHMLKGKVSRKSITRETVGLQEKRYSNSFDRQASRAITATNNVYMGDSLERKMENPSRGFFTDVLNEETVKDIRKWDVPKAKPIESRHAVPHAQSTYAYAPSASIHQSVPSRQSHHNSIRDDATLSGITETTPPQNIFLKLKWPFA